MTTKEELAAEKLRQEIRALRRREALAAMNDYLGFAVSKIAGLTAMVIGGVAIVDPALLHIAVNHPPAWLGSGLGLMTGKSVISILRKFLNVVVEGR